MRHFSLMENQSKQMIKETKQIIKEKGVMSCTHLFSFFFLIFFLFIKSNLETLLFLFYLLGGIFCHTDCQKFAYFSLFHASSNLVSS